MSAGPTLAEWFKDRPAWQKHVAKLLVEKDCLGQGDIDELVGICIKEVLGEIDSSGYSFPSTIFEDAAPQSLRLSSISNITGINALAPKKPLDFGKSSLSVIYGQNSSGKSGYVKILKHLCGARHPGPLHQNVYSPTPTKQTCTITYELDGNPVSHDWDAATGTIDHLCSVDIFDTHCGNVYVNKENEVTYEPPALSFFSELIRICQAVSGELERRQSQLISKKPVLPFTYTLTPSGKWYNGISSATTKEAVDANCDWNADKEKELGEITKRLAEQAPAERARSLRLQHGHLESIIRKVTTLLSQLSDEICQQIITLKETANQKAEAARIAAEQLFREVPLDGVGTEVWVQLWEHARTYSQEIAYRGESFPFVGNDARCVLCQQPLLDLGKKHLQSFEDHVKGEMQREADEAKKSLDEAFAGFGDIPIPANLKIEADAAGMGPESYAALVGIYEVLASRKNSMLGGTLAALPDIASWLEEARRLSGLYVEDATRFEGDAQAGNRTELNTRKVALEAVKWISQQRQAIEEEIHRFIARGILLAADKQTSTTGLSKKKVDLADSLITEAFVQRFKDELEKLNASHIKVELVKSKVEKGKVLHCLQLQGASEDSLHEILSEGEYRMISLAAFLADVTGKAHSAPFVFDDPISSLDQDFEEAVVRRLATLAKERQVIVFTHRLSLLGLIQEYGKKEGIAPEVVCVSREPWGTGEPGDTPTWAETPKKANNILLNKRLQEARKIHEEQGQRAYEMHAQLICTEFRKLLERTIEIDLMADVVQRFRREVQTKNKIGNLSKITDGDCRMLDDLMTKYSRYEHSQPGEAPVPLPNPDELKTDLEGLKGWREEFVARTA